MCITFKLTSVFLSELQRIPETDPLLGQDVKTNVPLAVRSHISGNQWIFQGVSVIESSLFNHKSPAQFVHPLHYFVGLKSDVPGGVIVVPDDMGESLTKRMSQA